MARSFWRGFGHGTTFGSFDLSGSFPVLAISSGMRFSTRCPAFSRSGPLTVAMVQECFLERLLEMICSLFDSTSTPLRRLVSGTLSSMASACKTASRRSDSHAFAHS